MFVTFDKVLYTGFIYVIPGRWPWEFLIPSTSDLTEVHSPQHGHQADAYGGRHIQGGPVASMVSNLPCVLGENTII